MNDLFALVARATVATSAAIVLVVVLRDLVRKRFGARAAYHLWLLPPAALAGVALPLKLGLIAAAPSLNFAPVEAVVAWSNQPGGAAGCASLILAIWAAGSGLSFLWVIASQRRFLRLAKAGLAGPAVVGAAFPRVVLPADFETRFKLEERRMILAHERVHLVH